MFQVTSHWDSLAIQWLGLHSSTAGGTGSIPGHGPKILQAPQPKKKKLLFIKVDSQGRGTTFIIVFKLSTGHSHHVLFKHYPSLKSMESRIL